MKKKQVGRTYICNIPGDLSSGETYNGFGYYETEDDGRIKGDVLPMEIGHIYKVVSSKNATSGAVNYVYVPVMVNGAEAQVGEIVTGITFNTVDAVDVLAYDSFVCKKTFEESGVTYEKIDALSDMSDYHEQFRCASTPWIVSELKGDAKDLQVKKLFRFHTITDGKEANTNSETTKGFVSDASAMDGGEILSDAETVISID